MDDNELIKNVFTSNSEWSHNNNVAGNAGNANAPAGNVGNNAGNNNSGGNSNSGGGGASGGDKSDRPPIFIAILQSMANNPFGQKVLALICVALIVLMIMAPKMMEEDTPNRAGFTYVQESAETRYRNQKPSLLKRIFCRGGKTSSFCSH